MHCADLPSQLKSRHLGSVAFCTKRPLTLLKSWAMWLWSRSYDATRGMTWESGASTRPQSAPCSGSPIPGAVNGSLWSAHWPDALVTQNASRATSCLSSVERAWGPTVLGLTDIRWIHLQFFFLISSLSLKWTIECHSRFELADLGIGCQAFNLGTIFLLLLILCFLLVALFTSANMTENTSRDLFISCL